MRNNILKLQPDCTTYDINNIQSGDLPLIPPGVYEAVLNTWFTGTLFKQAKVVLIYTITEGEFFGVNIPKYYNVKRLKNKAGRKGKFIAKPRGDLLKDFYHLMPGSPKLRADRVPITNLQQQPIKIKVATVKKDYKQQDYPEQMQYSIIREVNPC